MKQPVYFISHGGGPWPWMPEVLPTYTNLIAALQEIPKQSPWPPAAIVAVSAHWEQENTFGVMTHPQPPMYYDYYNFPAHTYQVKYPAPGSPELAARIMRLLDKAGLANRAEDQRGFDHGTFVPLSVMIPEANIPVVQVSIQSSYQPELHFELGRALAALRDENILIVCSGLSYHNLREIRSTGAEPSARFDAWLQQTVVQGPVAQRLEQLRQWEQAPAARQSHPREDHLVPLMVAAAAAQNDPATCIHHDTATFANITVSSFRFG